MPKLTPVHWKKLEKFFIQNGFMFARQSGSHRSYTKPGVSRTIVIPAKKEVPISIILKNLKTAEITKDEFLEQIEKL